MTLPRRIRAAAAAVLALAGSGLFASSAQAAPNCAGPASDTWINIVVDGVRNGNGLIAVTLYEDDSRKFLVKHGSLYVGRVDAAAPETRMCLFVPRPGVYAIAVYHDEDASGKINRSGVLGIPTEGFGFSNNPPTIASLPAFRSVRISIPRSNLSTRIHLKYP
ncbi:MULTISPECIES: DUF2141 domain-containing protein [unclassified Novosphingobium]|jgi:uncharacterized protein (DUF2141 family)|uniref:DUF2141 domain-containing protein n=1 Tax=unclassified Novosphingobium TaxID=2644732 RepID=UPI00061BC689|nr:MULTISPECIES: DUF2141 domain-containing protein [unclassified Novosphingobium]MBF5090348.1 DUF2141 domain-containing protein [Novosphingobium sp. NBM11]RQW42704.1 DUF2141 domain-containing protein [Novosphingobium sp. LASN5T]GAO54337.1 hypothetical protein NMD1_01433 [Novosphingobium sp. MD-1]